MYFHAAEKYCKSLGAHLIEFSTKAQYDFLLKSSRKCGVYSVDKWIGLVQKQGAWYWIHSKTKLNSFFQNKVRGTGGRENYQLINGGSWDPEGPSNSDKNVPVCQITF